MRHLGSLLLTILFAPAVYVLAGIGLVKFAAATDSGGGGGRMTMVAAGGALVAAGILYAVLTVSRLSPIGPFLAGLLYAGVSAWALLAHASFTGHVPFSVLGMKGVLTRPAPLAALLAVPLIATVFSAWRWRRDEEEDDTSPVPDATFQSYTPANSYQTGSFQTYEDPYRSYQ